MSSGTLYDKDLEVHTLRDLGNGRLQLFVDMHLIHEVTSPPAFANLRAAGIKSIPFPHLNKATMDHVVPTIDDDAAAAFAKGIRMERDLRSNCLQYGIELFDTQSGRQGIVHTIGPELGLTVPGIYLVCGDSHTSTHGAFGNLSHGIGTTQVEHVLRAQSLAHQRAKVRRIQVEGKLPRGVEAKDLALGQIMLMGSSSGVGYVNEWGGPVIDAMNMEARMTVTNLGAECQANASYMNPDQTTIDFLRGRERVPQGEAFDRATKYWLSFASDKDAAYDQTKVIDASQLRPVVTWGVNPGQAVFIDERIPNLDSLATDNERKAARKALDYTGYYEGELMIGKSVGAVFIGSCTNGRISDLQTAAEVMKGYHVADGVKVLVVPGSQRVKREAEALGLDKIFLEAGAEWRNAGCSMCLGMNTDRMDNFPGIIASTSNRNYQNRQGDATKTALMSPSMAAYAAIMGKIGDVREHVFRE